MAGARDARGPLVLVGGGDWGAGSSTAADLCVAADGAVLVMPTAAAFERPERAVAATRDAFAALGARVSTAMVLTRGDAEDAELAAVVRSARFIYLIGGSPLHLRSVLKDSAVLHALVGAWHDGAAVVGSSAGAMAFTDPMVDPRGGAFTVGLGLVRDIAVVPHHDAERSAQFSRTLALAPSSCAIVGLAERCAIVRSPDGVWRADGPVPPEVYLDGAPDSLAALAGKPVA